MRIILSIFLVSMLLLAGCGEAEQVMEEQAPPEKLVITQTVLSEAPPEEPPVEVRQTLRIVDYQLDPEEIVVPAGSIIDLSIESDIEIVLSFPGLGDDEKLVNTSIMTFTFVVDKPGTYEYYCVSGCEVPLRGSITAE